MQIYEVSLSRIEKMENLIRKFLKKWLRVPKSLTTVALYSSSTKLTLPTKSLVEEFKLGKARLFQMLRDSVDPLVKSAQPDIITGGKWDAKYAVETAESSLKMKEVIGSATTGRAGFGLHPQKWWSKETIKNKRRIVSEEIHHFEKKQVSRHSCGATQTRYMDKVGKTPRTEPSHGATSSKWSLNN